MVAVKEGSTQFVQFCIQYSSLALLYYDYILTFPLELQYMWRSKVKISTVFYWFCRYALLANLFYLFAIEKVVDNCKGWYQFDGYLSIAGRGAVLGVFGFRTYAVWNKSKLVLAVMSFLWAVVIALDFWHTTGDKCSGGTAPDIVVANTALSIVVCVFECTGTVLLGIRCLKARRAFKKSNQSRPNDDIMSFMLREGLVYFFGVFGFTFAAVVLNFEAPTGFLGKLLNALTLPVSGILSARLLLYLRQHNHRQKELAMRGSQARTFTNADGEEMDALPSFHAATMTSLDGTRSIFASSNADTYGEGEFGGDPVAGVLAELAGGKSSEGKKAEVGGSSRDSSYDGGDELNINVEPRQKQDAEMGQPQPQMREVRGVESKAGSAGTSHGAEGSSDKQGKTREI
ncbi:hypothetical protein CONPUDRAFT_134592 [Coniophora puteana RWD-64-598 SS2]|uniref:DUF6533 domain-containing protein n=1 Tax=Coniophora puteana (strain RWD-64-598) TaxID=741705 RepID=A0A5M3N8M0_CONPW|nr:uncharacterized protein CONPUDRAFT_134592 [Coniophora puteana RWD-64-598 SS2]EIW87454.1 hypothetical protein CONPUDRAFT_134592 [Coniophora puteana RWD-64-598 SS2]